MTAEQQSPSAERREEVRQLWMKHGRDITFWNFVAVLDAQHAERTVEFNANVDRLKACEHIADGDDGWESLRNECPSTAAVARLRDSTRAEVEKMRERCLAALEMIANQEPRDDADIFAEIEAVIRAIPTRGPRS